MVGENDDIAYWRRRLAQSEALARGCPSPSITKVHNVFVALYAQRLQEAEQRLAT